MPGRVQDLAGQRARRQKIFVGAGLAVLLGIVGFEVLPSVVSGGSGGGASSAPPPSVPVSRPAVAAASTTGPKLPHSVVKATPRDPFMPLVSAGPVNAAAILHTLNGPPVRAKNFVVKDPFIQQLKVPSTPIAPPSQGHPATPAPTPSPPQRTAPRAWIVVIGSIPGKGAPSLKAAARAVVAAKNAGLKDVVANDALPGAKDRFTVFTGPYPSAAEAHAELVRALRNGYPHATTVQLKSTPAGGF
jgi:hypothetical protein